MKNRNSIYKRVGISIIILSFMGFMISVWRDKNQPVQSVEEEEVVTLAFFDKNSGDNIFNDRIANEIMNRTGVKIELIDPTDNAGEKLNLMLASKEYPDIMLMDLKSGDILSKYITSGALIDMEPLIQEYGENVTQMYGDILGRLKDEDGRIYYLSNWYGEDEDAVCGFLLRYDILAGLVGRERADSAEPFTEDEFFKILEKYEEIYSSDGQNDTMAITVNTESYGYLDTFYGMFGLKKYYETEDGLKNIVYHPRYIDMILFINRLYREGYLDKEWIVNKTNLYERKLESGLVFATLGAYWDVIDSNTKLRNTNGEEAVFYCYKVVGEGIDAQETTYSGRNSLGWDAIGITNNCENTQAAMKVIDFLASEEGQYLMLWGIEGENWVWQDDIHVPMQTTLELFRADEEKAIQETGIRKWTWFIKNGVGSDGTPYDLTTKYRISDEARIANQNISSSDYWDTAIYDNLEPAVGSSAALKQQNIQDIYTKAFPKMVNASTAGEALIIYEKLIQDMETEGLGEVETVINQNYKKRLELWQK